MRNQIDNGDKSMIKAPTDLIGGEIFAQGDAIGVVGDTVREGQDVAIIHRQEMEDRITAAQNTTYAYGTPVYTAVNPAAGAPKLTLTAGGVKIGFLSRAFTTGAGQTTPTARFQVRG